MRRVRLCPCSSEPLDSSQPYLDETSRGSLPRHCEDCSMKLKRFWNDESGATAIEYGLIAGLIAVVIITAVTTVGTKVSNQFSAIASKLN